MRRTNRGPRGTKPQGARATLRFRGALTPPIAMGEGRPTISWWGRRLANLQCF